MQFKNVFNGFNLSFYYDYYASYLGDIYNMHSILIKAENLYNFHISEETNVIAPFAFCECRLLEKIVIPKSVKFIENNAFFGCKNLKEIIFEEKNHWFKIVKIHDKKLGLYKNVKIAIDVYNEKENAIILTQYNSDDVGFGYELMNVAEE